MLSDMRTVRYKMQEFYISLINLSVTMLLTTSDVHLLFTLWVFCHLIFLKEILMVLFKATGEFEAQYKQYEAICPWINTFLELLKKIICKNCLLVQMHLVVFTAYKCIDYYTKWITFVCTNWFSLPLTFIERLGIKCKHVFFFIDFDLLWSFIVK